MKTKTIALQNSHPHNTRDERFSEMGRGDITGWSRATTSFRRPEVNGRNLAPSVPIHDLATLRTTYASSSAPLPHDAAEVVLISGPEKEENVAEAIESMRRKVELTEKFLAIADRLNRHYAACGSFQRAR